MTETDSSIRTKRKSDGTRSESEEKADHEISVDDSQWDWTGKRKIQSNAQIDDSSRRSTTLREQSHPGHRRQASGEELQ